MSQRSDGRPTRVGATGAQGSDGEHQPGRAGADRGLAKGRFGWWLRLLTVAALAVDVFVHATLASTFDPIKATFSQGQLFRVEAAAAAVAGVLILIWTNRVAWLFAVLVLVGGLAAVLFYQFVDPGPLGPLPDMYDPQWSLPKAASVVAEALGAIFAAIGLVRSSGHGRELAGMRRRRR